MGRIHGEEVVMLRVVLFLSDLPPLAVTLFTAWIKIHAPSFFKVLVFNARSQTTVLSSRENSIEYGVRTRFSKLCSRSLTSGWSIHGKDVDILECESASCEPWKVS